MEFIIGAVVVVGLLAWAVSIYNRLVALRNRYKNGFAQIDVQLKRRYDLIPNLVETARAYMAHERETLEALIVARNTALTAAGKAAQAPGEAAAMRGLASAEAGLSGALSKLFALSEAHPDLKANQTMMQLSEELSSTENKVAFARQAFNDSVMEFNTCVESFPDLVFAGAFGFPRAELLALENPAEERQAPKVSFR
ncbi:MAG: LemA family protein [Rhodoferax sp.]|uniref:LemA family protein n=1 Tax=Rhodoferax sp. TaxID=50421 RepID=UPI00260E0C5B|nr:LemA family protein [Rhodoferax sp.]MDD5333464.1 LemA family protein [Rhodoferax sp.]